MAARAGAQKISLLKRGFHELPELMLGLGLGIVGIALGINAIYQMHKDPEHNHMYRQQYSVIRDTKVKDKSKIGDIYN